MKKALYLLKKILKTSFLLMQWRLQSFFGTILPNAHVQKIQGSKMYLNCFYKEAQLRHTFRSYSRTKIWEPVTTSIFRKILGPGDTVLDLGANIGYFTLLSAKLVGDKGRVYAFEPEPANYFFLQKNITLNGYRQVKTYPKAVSDQNGKTNLYVCSYDTGHHMITTSFGIDQYKPELSNAVKDKIEIQTLKVDDFVEQIKTPVSVIKMDIEGAEAKALIGMEKTIKENRDIGLFVEFFPFLIRQMGDSPEKFLHRLMKDFNMLAYMIEADYMGFHKKVGKDIYLVDSPERIMSLCSEEKSMTNLYFTHTRSKRRLMVSQFFKDKKH